MNRIFKGLWLFLAATIIVAAIISSLFRALTPWATQYKQDIEQQLSNMLGSPVTIERMDTGWYWFEPVFNLNQVKIQKQQETVIELRHLAIGINLLKSLVHWRIQPGVLLIDGIHLNLYQTDNGWQIEGLNNNTDPQTDLSSYEPVLAVLLSQQKTVVKHLSADLHLKEGMQLPLRNLRLTLLNSLGHYQLKGGGELDQPYKTHFEVLSEMRLNSNNLQDLKGHAFLSIKHFLPSQWQPFFSEARFQCLNGEGNAQFWIDWAGDKLTKLQSTLHFKGLSFQDKKTSKQQEVQDLSANLAWRTTPAGWQMLADHVKLCLDHYEWPENTLMFAYNRETQTHFIYAKHLILRSLVNLKVEWPEVVEKNLPKHLHGHLYDTRLQVKEGALNYVLSRFSKLSWEPKGEIPGIKNLEGVVQWEPMEGALSLTHDEKPAHPFTLTLPPHPPLIFSEFNTRLNWKRLSQGLRVRLDHFVLAHPDLLLSAEGVADRVTKESQGLLRLKANFSTHNTEKWFTYLPKSWMRPSLDEWLKTAIKHIDKAGGEVVVDGDMTGFPFDHAPGEFYVKSYLSGVDVVPAAGWPKISALETYLNINKRMFEMEATQGKVKDLPLRAAHLRIDDVGLDKETLLLHAQSNTQGKALIDYIEASPLKAKFSSLKGVEIKGPVGVDLSIEMPLYSSTAPIRTQGEIAFQDDTLSFPTGSNALSLDQLMGGLKFTEAAILPSEFKARLLGEPLLIKIDTKKTPSPGTEIWLKGLLPIEKAAEKFGTSVSSVLTGTLPFEGSFLSHVSGPADLAFQSNLEGLTVLLPAPLGKTKNTTRPFKVTGKLQSNALQLDANYGDLNVALTKETTKDDWKVRLDSELLMADVIYQTDVKRIAGRFEKLHWQTVPQAVSNKPEDVAYTLNPSSFPNLDLQIDDLKWDAFSFGTVKIKAESSKNHWTVQELNIRTPYYQFSGKGAWAKEDVVNETVASGNLVIRDLAKSLISWQYEPLIEASRGNVNFQGHWPGSFFDFNVEKAEGEIGIVLKNGRIPNLNASTEEKIGLGKLLSILSLQTLPRRLTFDFSDLSKGGYSFDQFKGSLKLVKGVLATKDSDMDGPVAHATIKGNIDLNKQFFDLDIGVYPHITASLPVVATIAGGPLAGIATWAASKILDEGIQKVTGYTYKVFGPWKQPTVQPVKIIKKKSGN